MSYHINPNMQPIPNLFFLNGPVLSQNNRTTMDVLDNASPSILDAIFPKERHEHIEQAKTKKEATSTLTIKIENLQKLEIDKSARKVLHVTALEDHIEERIGAFLLQIIDCFDTDLHFTIGTTQAQTNSTSPVKYKVAQRVETETAFASTHHGTLPCIYAYPREEWEIWKAKNNHTAPGKPQASVYLYKSDTYYANNACTGLYKFDNVADIDLDGNSTEKIVEFGQKKPEKDIKLREYTITLLNRAAIKEITPVQGFGLYMEKMKVLIGQLEIANPSGEKKLIFSTWKRVLEEIDVKYHYNYKLFIARVLGIRIPTSDRDTINLEEIIYPRHFEILQKKNYYQATLASKIVDLRKKILDVANKTKAPNNFDKALKLGMMKEAFQRDEQIRIIFQRYYNLSGKSIDSLETECTLPALNVIERDDSKKNISDFFDEFSQYIYNFRIDQTKFSAGLIKEIRIVQGLTLSAFSQKYNEMFPLDEPLNDEQLYQIEEGCVEPSSTMIRQISNVLNVHMSILKADF